MNNFLEIEVLSSLVKKYALKLCGKRLMGSWHFIDLYTERSESFDQNIRTF